MQCRAVPVPLSDAVLSIAGSVNLPALGALFQRPWPWVLGRAELEWGQDSHQGTRIGTLVPRSPSRCSWGPGPRHNQGLGGFHTRVWLWSGTEAKFLQESRFLPSPSRSSPSPRCPPCSGRGLRWGPRHPGCPLPPAQPGMGSRDLCGARSPATLPPAALMMSDGRYVLNGDWSIAWPGPLEVAGTWLRYTRAPDGTESLEAPGPTAEDLHLMVMLGTVWGQGQPPPAPIAPLSAAPARTGPAAGAQPWHRV